MLKSCMLLVSALAVCPLAEAQIFQRELGDFDLKLGTTPSRTMAQGLVKPTSPGSDAFHGGLDLSHDSGLYFGQFSPNMGLSSPSTLEVDSYMGFKHPFDQTLGYEVGLIHYSYPKVSPLDSQAFYGGLNLLGNRFGVSFSNDPDRQDSTLFADLGGTQPFGVGVSVKYTTHQLGTPASVENGAISSFSDWSVQLSRAWKGVDLDLIYSDSSLSGGDCSAYSGHNSQCDGLLTLKAVRSFY
ncbi:Bacterial protein of unknown function (Gcw_chp) [Pseudomonas sp. 34 E 7]|uniref:TorF family putative porin n=1 Tax=Pseudomonas sp. 34 E 7 TaxID=1844102 RepID=UPI0008128730|nr:TorF family putative porin [Pseudomonas sp. 34 E 7]CRN01439.1 Bacterial protein of unknown function (Gcw_chp) [Pseudomonas sp. 34 E 7]